MQSAIERWRELQDVRAQQMNAAYARLGRTSADFWDRRARNFHYSTKDRVGSDPLLLRIRQVVKAQTRVLDVGAGTGRFTLALAPQAQHITAVEPNAAMLSYLRQDATEQGFSNISYISTSWEDAPAELTADIVICSHVLYPIREIEPFLAKLRSATREACYIYMRATSFDAYTSQFWQHFHGEPRHQLPGYIHALDVMYDMGIYADVEIVRTEPSMRYSSLDSAVEEIAEQLILPDDEATRAELRKLLFPWLVRRDEQLTIPVEEMACAIITMRP